MMQQAAAEPPPEPPPRVASRLAAALARPLCSSPLPPVAPIHATQAELEAALLRAVDAGTLADSAEFAAAQGVDHLALVGLLKSLIAAEMIATEASAAPREGTAVARGIARRAPLMHRRLAPRPGSRCSKPPLAATCPRPLARSTILAGC